MGTSSKPWPHTMTSGLLAGRTFESSDAYRYALGEARLRKWIKRQQADIELLLAAHTDAVATQRQTAKTGIGTDELLSKTAQRLTREWRYGCWRL
jgi:hypothetical protein